MAISILANGLHRGMTHCDWHLLGLVLATMERGCAELTEGGIELIKSLLRQWRDR